MKLVQCITVFIKAVTIMFDIHVSLKYQVKSFNSFRSLRFESPRDGEIVNAPSCLRLERYTHS